MKRSVFALLFLVSACGNNSVAAKDQSGTPEQAPVTSTTLSTVQGTPTPESTPQTGQGETGTTVVTTPTPAATAAPLDGTTAATGTAVDANVNNANAVVDANDTNPNHLSTDPVTGLLDYRYGTFEGSQMQPNDPRDYDGCSMLAGNSGPTHFGFLTLNGPAVVFSYDPNSQKLANGTLTWLTALSPTYTPGTRACSYTVYPDGTGTYNCYMPATATTASCYTTVVLKIVPRAN